MWGLLPPDHKHQETPQGLPPPTPTGRLWLSRAEGRTCGISHQGLGPHLPGMLPNESQMAACVCRPLPLPNRDAISLQHPSLARAEVGPPSPQQGGPRLVPTLSTSQHCAGQHCLGPNLGFFTSYRELASLAEGSSSIKASQHSCSLQALQGAQDGAGSRQLTSHISPG